MQDKKHMPRMTKADRPAKGSRKGMPVKRMPYEPVSGIGKVTA